MRRSFVETVEGRQVTLSECDWDLSEAPSSHRFLDVVEYIPPDSGCNKLYHASSCIAGNMPYPPTSRPDDFNVCISFR